VTISCAGSDRKTQQKVGRTDSKTQKAIGQTKEAYFDKSLIMISKLVTAVLVQLGGPPPGFPQKEHFCAGRPQQKHRGKAQISNGLQQDRG
jgi:hypothetical protein